MKEFIKFLISLILAVIVLNIILAGIVMWLWNWLMTDMFSLPLITYWEALGLMFLSNFLIKSYPINNN